MREHGAEPIPGLPERLPAGEEILWQGGPRWWSLYRRVFHIRTLCVYFGVFVVWRAAVALADGHPLPDAIEIAAWLLPFLAVALAMFATHAYMICRGTIYTITNRRIVMRFGVAVPLTINLPFQKIMSAALKVHGDGTGDIPLAIKPPDRIAYLQLWPHVRPWRFNPAEPCFRSIREPQRVADLLAGVLIAALPPEQADEQADQAAEANGPAATPLAPDTPPPVGPAETAPSPTAGAAGGPA